jgi:ElaB/YqjD/DUF883 family membrane-anchored ribosome-binding protein
MGEDARAGGTRVTGEEGTREPEDIRRDIDSTRDELGDTVAALAEKTDVKAQAQKKVAEVKQTVSAKRTELVEKARASSPDGASSAAASAKEKARENPLPVAVAGAFAAGLIVGRILKR